MPELPEVETTRRGITPSLINQTIKKVVVRNRNLRLPVPEQLNSLCTGKQINHVERRAKYLIIHLSQGALLIHLGMSGQLRICRQSDLPQSHDHIDMHLSNGKILRYKDPRRFGLWQYTADSPLTHKLLKALGPEPLSSDFHANYAYLRIQKTNRPIKSLIMDNHIVVGVGNIYATESLYLAGLHPLTPGKNVTRSQVDNLIYHIKKTLQKAIAAGGTTLKDFYTADGTPGYFAIQLHVYGRQGLACLNCEDTLQSLVISGRRSTFCPTCQTGDL